MIFVREQSADLTSLVKKIDQKLNAVTAKPQRALGAYVLFLNNTPSLDRQLRRTAATESLKHVLLCIGAPPKNYDVNPEADVTVVIYNPGWRPEQHVTANFAFRKGELNDANTDAIVKALAQVLPK